MFNLTLKGTKAVCHMETQPVAHVNDITNLFMSIMDEQLETDSHKVTLKISADHGQKLLKIGLEVQILF